MSHLLPNLSCPFVLAFNAILLANGPLNKLRNKRGLPSPFAVWKFLVALLVSYPGSCQKFVSFVGSKFLRKNKVIFSHLHLRFVSCLLPGVLPVKTLIHLVVYLTTGPKPLPKRALHIVRSRAFSFKWEYPLFSLRSSNSFLRLLPRLPVTSIPPCIFPSIIRCRRQFLRKMWPIQFAFRLRFHVGYSSAPWL